MRERMFDFECTLAYGGEDGPRLEVRAVDAAQAAEFFVRHVCTGDELRVGTQEVDVFDLGSRESLRFVVTIGWEPTFSAREVLDG